MCTKCTEDNREYTHMSDLAMLLTEAFNASNGADLPIIVDDLAGDRYWEIARIVHNEEAGRYELGFSYGSKTR